MTAVSLPGAAASRRVATLRCVSSASEFIAAARDVGFAGSHLKVGSRQDAYALSDESHLGVWGCQEA